MQAQFNEAAKKSNACKKQGNGNADELHAMKKTVASLKRQDTHLCLRVKTCTNNVICQTLSNRRTATKQHQHWS
ncbi:hypothetical protein CCR75_006036 [Bremia lactucae]|uniref:Uncharacterized protein n=1 Tax=Bremia lactucae TaxID=4779 RepID=A0A976FMC5_BRELC|nr:hypothetical protein CCR75_006036 [Bremia lactucae]